MLRLLEGETCSFDADSEDQPAKRVCRPTYDNDDPFAALRAVPEDSCSVECDSKSATDLEIEFKRYMEVASLPKFDDVCL